ncbi:MAG: sulfite exporter TauE/SafE family protein, partial [Betaproteobacteria bacterium]|nr:sulfite exporter TauE/SafE family protein [Betaproteobacteria bacterium]
MLLAYFIRGITGFGSGLIAVPLLAHFMPLQFVVPFVLVLDFTASITLGGKIRQHIDWRELKPLLPFGALGVMLGVT